MTEKKVNVFWFRRDLRIEDNHALYRALVDDVPVLPIFIFDANILDDLRNPSDARVTFIYDRVKDLQEKLARQGCSFRVFHGQPLPVFEKLLQEYTIEKVFVNRDYEPYAKQRDQEVSDFLRANKISFNTYRDHVIFEGSDIEKEDGSTYKVFTPYKKKWLEQFNEKNLREYPSLEHSYRFVKTGVYPIPQLGEIGFKRSRTPVPTASINEDLVRNYGQKRDFPALQATSKLGVHLRHGTVSIRKVVAAAKDLSPVWLLELIWREFYSMILDRFPRVVSEEFNRKYKTIPWRYNEMEFGKWCRGETGFPIVDAGMRELNQTGFMHNRARMITASFLTKHLLIDWRWGEAYFAGKLLDYELASNNGGWQWAAGCGTDAQPYFRIFNPYEQAKKFDPENRYIQKWVPEINTKNYPDPIIDHKFARQRAIETFKKTLTINEHRG